MGRERIDLRVDPLKFEERQLATKKQLASLKKRYGISSNDVILGGSLNFFEAEMLLRSCPKILKRRPESQIVIVGRNMDD